MKRKKWGAILLAVCMIFTMFPTIALAASGPPDEKKVIENDLIVQLPNSLDAMIDTSPSAWLAVTSEPKWDDGTILDYVKATQEFYDSANNKLTEADTFQDNSRYMMKMTFQSFDSYYGDYYYVLSETNKVYVDFVGVNGQRYPMNVTVDKDANDNPVITATYSFSIGTPPEEPSQEAHAWDSAWVVTTKPTCTEKGKKTRTCTKCGKTETASIPAVGHSFGEYKITKQPTALATGTKTRTCTKCGKTESIAIAKLKPIIALSATKLPLQLKKSTTVLKVTKMQTGDKVASFTSSNSKIVTVHKTSGKLTAKKVGKAIITVKLKSGKSAKCVVTVQKTPVKTTKIQVKPSSLKLKKGKKVKLATVLTPLTSQEKVTFTSSNKKIATVSSSGVVTAKKEGKVKITAKSGKKKVTCTITVTAK